jgi:type II secretory pathway component PulF
MPSKISQPELIRFLRLLASFLSGKASRLDQLEADSFLAPTPSLTALAQELCSRAKHQPSPTPLSFWLPEDQAKVLESWITGGHQPSNLEYLIKQLACEQEYQANLRRPLKKLLVTGMVMVLVLGSLLWGVVPQFQPIFTAMNLEPPWVTQWILSLACLAPPFPVTLGLLSLILWKLPRAWRFLTSPSCFGQGILLAQGLPPLRNLVNAALRNLLAGKLARLMAQGVSLSEALEILGSPGPIAPLAHALGGSLHHQHLPHKNQLGWLEILPKLSDRTPHPKELATQLEVLLRSHRRTFVGRICSLGTALQVLQVLTTGGLMWLLVLAMFMPMSCGCLLGLL